MSNLGDTADAFRGAAGGVVPSVQAYDDARRAWFLEIAERVAEAPRPIFVDRDLSSTEVALLTLRVGLGHLAGQDGGDLTVGGVLDRNEVDALIQNWRTGNIDPMAAQQARHIWSALCWMGQLCGQLRSGLFEELQMVVIEGVAQDTTTPDWVAQPRLHRALEAAIEARDVATIGTSELNNRRDAYISGGHFGVVRWILAQYLSKDSVEHDLGSALLPELSAIEMATALGDARDDRLREWLNLSRAARSPLRAGPGSWPSRGGVAGGSVPAFVRAWARSHGGRHGQYSTGFVPNWFFILESPDEVAAVRRYSFNPGLGIDISAGRLEFVVPFPAEDGAQPYYASIFYPSDVEHMLALAILAAVGRLRVDLYELDRHSKVKYVGSFGLVLPSVVLRQVREHLDSQVPDAVQLTTDYLRAGRALVAPADTASAHAWQAENARFDMLSDLMRYRLRLPSGGWDAIRQSMLDAIAAEAYRQTPDLKDLGEVIGRYREVIAQERRRYSVAESARVLGPLRAFVHIDAPYGLIQAVATWIETGGAKPKHVELDFSAYSGPHPTETPSEFAEWTGIYEQICTLGALVTEHGITSAVLSPGAELYGAPIDEMLISIGFVDVSFSPSLDVLKLLSELTRANGSLKPFTVLSTSDLSGVAAETAILRSLSGAVTSDKMPKRPAGVLHIAGHGRFAPGIASASIDVGSRTVFAAEILRDFDLRNVEIMVLSVCSSGLYTYSTEQVLDPVALGVAALGAGARVVVSTAWPVNDVVAFTFAVVFHECLRAGWTVSEAFRRAKHSARDLEIPEDFGQLKAAISATFPAWFLSRDRVLPVDRRDWLAYRLSGLHWVAE